jgi:hypothetical protein
VFVESRTRFCLIRILGNDLPPLHRLTQSLENLDFILRHEPRLAGCEKRFLLNRIVDADREAALAERLESAGVPVDRIPFHRQEYLRCVTPTQKMHYLTNNNPARNFAFAIGRRRADVVLPFDGQLFFTARAWCLLASGIDAAADTELFAVPMHRLAANAQLCSMTDDALLTVASASEPQLVFRREAEERYDPAIRYAAGDKVDLLLRLGVPGPWDHWPGAHFQRLRAHAALRRSRYFGSVVQAGYVFRLAPGSPETVNDIRVRNAARRQGLSRLVARVDAGL